MPAPSAAPILIKKRRFQKLSEELKREVDAFHARNPYELVHRYDAEMQIGPPPPPGKRQKGVHCYRIVTREKIPEQIPVLAGEGFQLMRSALDYLAWQLALAMSASPPLSTEFPIFLKERKYDEQAPRKLRGIDPTIHELFRSVQPFHAGEKAESHPLWVLHRMANDDKHRTPHVISSVPQKAGVVRPEGVDLSLASRIGPFSDDEEIVHVSVIDGAPPETELDLDVNIQLAFGLDTPSPGALLLPEIGRVAAEMNVISGKFGVHFNP